MSIFKAVKLCHTQFKGELLDVGCGKMPYKDYILANSRIERYTGLDIENAMVYDSQISPDYIWDGIKMPFNVASFDSVMATEVLEHCPDPIITLKEINRVLKPNGTFFFTVPFLWNLHETPYDYYRYTPFAIQLLLQKSGFKEIELRAAGGWHASMAQMLGLWIRRSPISSNKKKILSVCLKPIIQFLIKLDAKRPIKLNEGQMITSLYGTAIKV